ncbi:MAG: SRPBCC family protein [Rhizobacter sp.]
MIAGVVLAVIALALAALLIFAASRPSIFRVARSARILASAEKILPLINDIHRFNTWNPYNHKDPTMKATYRGPNAGPGAAFDFEGSKNVGKGSIEIIQPSGPNRVTMTLDMTAPMACHNIIDFVIEPEGNATVVTWAMHGPNPFIGKLMSVVFNMDRMVGRDFDAGLASLKTLAEHP